MNKNIRPGNWIKIFLLLTLALVVLLSALMYIVDPFFQFRVRDNSYILNPRYVNAGLIKNYDYDTLLIGSSVTQNFDMDVFREELGAKPLHLSMGGIDANETAELMILAKEVDRAEHYYIGVDLSSMCDAPRKSNSPAYLFKSDPLSTARYLVSYEAWFRFLPVDMGFIALQAAGLGLPDSFAENISIDKLGSWESGAVYGEDVVLEGYSPNIYTTSSKDLALMQQNMEKSLDQLLAAVEGVEEKCTFFFPPYSMLYWHDVSDTMELYMQAKQQLIARAEAAGCTVFDFQHAPLCMDLGNYKDARHFSGEINDYMTRCFASGEYRVGSADFDSCLLSFNDNLEQFREKYQHVLMK